MYPIRTMARVLEGFGLGLRCCRRSRPASARATADADLTRYIRTIHAGSHGTHGAPRVHAELKADGLSVGRKRIARLMRAAGIAGVSRCRNAPITTRQATDHHPASELVRRNFMAERPNELWVADITFLPTLAGFLYLAVVLDVPGRAGIVGWAFSADLEDPRRARRSRHGASWPESSTTSSIIRIAVRNTRRSLSALAMQGSRRSSIDRPGRRRSAYDNAMCESFFATLECELIDRRRFRSHSEARMAVFQFIEGFYNLSRRHSALGYLSPSNTKGT